MPGRPRGGIAKGGQGGRAGKEGSHRKGAAIGSGGQGKKKLEGRKATPKAELRTGHPAARKAAAAARRAEAGVKRASSGGANAASATRPVDQWPSAGGGDLEPVVDALVQLAVEARADARARKDWAQADALRDRLTAAGIVLEDTPSGVRWRRST